MGSACLLCGWGKEEREEGVGGGVDKLLQSQISL